MSGLRRGVVWAAVLTGAASCHGGGDPEEVLVVSVRAAPVSREEIHETATATCSVLANQEALLSTPLAGQLGPVALLQARDVHTGEVLATLDAVDAFAADRDLRDAKARVASLERLVERRRALAAQGGISGKDLEESELELAMARDDLEAAGHSVSAMSGPGGVDASGRVTIRAPFDGVVIEQLATTAGYVAEGTPLFRVADLSTLRVRCAFSDTVGPRITVGSQAMVDDEALPGPSVSGEVVAVGRATDPLTRTVEVWVRVDEPGDRLRAGDGARVTADVAMAADALVVPRSALSLDAPTADEGTIMVVGDDGLAHETRVRIGLRTEDRVQVLDGLTGNERVIVEGNHALPDGTKVEVAPEDAREADAG